MSFSINWDTGGYKRAIECLKENEKTAYSAMYNPETGYVTLGNNDKVSDEQLAREEPKLTPLGSTWDQPDEPVYLNGHSHPIWIRHITGSATTTGRFQYTTETSGGATTAAPPMFRGPTRVATYSTTADTPGITWYRDDTLPNDRVYAWDNQIVGQYLGDSKATKKHQKQIEKANKKSFELLKEWLSEAEYNYLMEEGQLELPSQYEKDTIYIVDKNPMKRIGIKKEGKVVEKSLCIHAEHSYADGDILLGNIMLLKTDEKKFLEIANVHDYTA